MEQSEQQLLFFSTLLQLEKQARLAETPTDLKYTIVNDTIRLIKYRQALLWQPGLGGRPVIKSISGIDSPDKNAPFVIYSHKLLRHLDLKKEEPQVISDQDLPESFHDGWQEWSFGSLLCCPLIAPNGHRLGGIVFSRDTVWQEAEISLIERLTEAYAHALAALIGKRPSSLGKKFRNLPKRFLQLIMIVFVIFALDQPVRLSALAPVEIVPFKPLLVSSPIDSVIDTFNIEPNQTIQKGDLLFSLDNTITRNQYQVAQKSLEVLETEYRREKQKSFLDAQSRAMLLNLEATMEQKEAEIDYLKELLSRSNVHAEQSGIAVFGDVHDWLGKPVVVGERVLTIADPKQIEAEMMLPVADAINLEPGAEVLIFLNIKPDAPLSASLRQASFEATITKESVLSFRLRAELSKDEELPRIGLRGTAKIYGEEVTLFYYLMRKPMIYVRQLLGV